MPNIYDQFDSPLYTYGPIAPPNDEDVAEFIVKKAVELGKDPQEALKVWANEGKGAWQSNYKMPSGRREPSYGPMQLYTGGGLGNQFQEETGLDPSDPRTWQEGTGFALERAAQGGWGPWYGAKRAGIQGDWTGAAPQQTAQVEPMRASEPQPYDAAQESPPPPEVNPYDQFDDFPQDPAKKPVPPGMAMDFNRKPPETQEGWPLGNPFTDPNTQYDPTAAIAQLTAGVGQKLGMSPTGAAKLGRDAYALPQSLGPLGYEFVPLDSVPRPPKSAPVKVVAAAETAATELPEDTLKIGRLSQAEYDASKAAGLKVKGSSFNRLVVGMLHKAKKENISTDLHPGTSGALKTLVGKIEKRKYPDKLQKITGVTPRAPRQSYTLEDLDSLNRIINTAQAGIDPKYAQDRRLAEVMSDRMDEFLHNLRPNDIEAGDPAEAIKAIDEARDLWARMKKAELLDGLEERALNALGANYSAAQYQTAIKQQFRQAFTPPVGHKVSKHMRRFNAHEREFIQKIIRGDNVENALRYLGKFAPSSPLMALLGGGAAYSLGGPLGAAGLAAGASAARYASSKMTQANIAKLNKYIRTKE